MLGRRRPPEWSSPTFTAEQVPDAVWARRSELRGIAFDLDAQERLLAELAPLGRELGETGYEFANNFYEHVDAEVAHGMVRRLRPARVVELGSGFSTHVLRAALAANGSGELRTFDPFTKIDGVERVAAQDVPDPVFAALGSGDVLFVDTTHVVRTGGDVNRIVLDVLPALAPGVVVHFHDIWLPYEYDRRLTEHLGANWSEQYLLQALLSGNPGFEVLLGCAALARDRREAVRAAFPDWDPEREYPSAFWIRRAHG